ncbi:serine/threonine protein kinase [Egbenema bharatensis]|uniref:serine/threonine protein kinase n=1 Tax=Egbenema bharatensis TaxID=3463334 RepID=UPI003A895F1D
MIWTPGQHLRSGKYEIQDVLGQGGFGITYIARHFPLQEPALEESVVIKTPNEHLKHDPDYEKYVQRFIKEGQTLAWLSQESHPHIVRFWDFFEEEGIPCLVMDFVPGENLFQLVRQRGALPEDEIVPYIRQIGEALSTIHEAGLVHRDAHPGNIIIRPHGKAVLIDFGIAKELVPSTQSSTGEAGNRGFAPYEQISRGSREPVVDVYCLAATLYYAVTGQRPVTSLDRKLHDAVLTTPRQIQPALSKHLNWAILEGMALEADERPQSMPEWLKLLEEPRIASPPPHQNPAHVTYSAHSGYSAHSSHSAQSSHPTQATPYPIPPGSRYPRTYRKKSAQTASAPLGWLILTFTILAALGIALNIYSKPLLSEPLLLAWALILAGAGIGTLAKAKTGVMIGSVVWGLTLAAAGIGYEAGALPGTVVWTLAWAGVGAWAGALILIMAMVLAGVELSKSFSNFQTFLILLSTSLAGLWVGWTIGMSI